MEWSDLTYLLAVARTGSLSGAADELGVATSTAARRIAALERALDLRLVDRRSDGALLTKQGKRMAELAQGVSREVAEVERAAAALRQDASSEPIRVTATEAVVSDVLAPALPRLWERDATLRVDLVVQPEVVSLANREADIAIRMARPSGDSLVARQLGTIRLGLYASRDYLAGRSPAALDLTRERLLLYDESYGRIPEVLWLREADLAGAVWMRTASTRALLRAAVSGAGIALLPDVFAARERTLVAIRAPQPIPPRTPWLLVHRDLRALAPVRAVSAWVVTTFAALLGKRIP
jgi:DNA-binding transcriptional LysR family regulator